MQPQALMNLLIFLNVLGNKKDIKKTLRREILEQSELLKDYIISLTGFSKKEKKQLELVLFLNNLPTHDSKESDKEVKYYTKFLIKSLESVDRNKKKGMHKVFIASILAQILKILYKYYLNN